MLEKSQTLLQRGKVGNKFVRFTTCADEGDPSGVCQDLYMPIDYYTDFGSPEFVTVTVEPGDKLNTKKGKVKA